MRELHTEAADAPSTPDSRDNRNRRRADTAADRLSSLAEPDRQAIETRAYELYLERGRSDGDDVNDWLRAEQELSGR